MTIFEKRLEAALDTVLSEMNPIAWARSKGAFGHPTTARPTPPQPVAPAAPVHTSPLEKFSKAPYNIPDHLIKALMADPEDGEVFNAIAYQRGKPVAGLLRQAIMGEPLHRPTLDDMRD